QDGNTITNTYDGITNNENPADPDNPQEPVTISALKVWTDVPSNVRLPNGVTLTLIRSDGVSMGERRIDAPAGQAPWTCEWSGLKKYAPNSTSYAYTVEEPEVPLGFYVMYEGNGADGYTVTNRYAPAMYDSGADINVADLFE
ncbi:MAG: Cna B-type domain-containing protein, partial [Clostridiales bacterium]|nr:Cna B-type domain-containing protein [Clostridiales bacterium]